MGVYTVLCFSGTGNTLLAARALQGKLAEGAEVNMIDMSATPDWRPLPGRTLIFAWPVYSYGMPRLVLRFLKRLPKGENSVYCLCTMGGDAGGARLGFSRLLRAKGYQVMGGIDLLMPNNYVGGRVPDPVSVQKLLEAVHGKIEEFVQAVLREERIISAGSIIDPLSAPMNAGFRLVLPFLHRGFKLNKTACNSCAICAKACPVGNIAMDQYPRWGSACEFCLRCLHICPQTAIDYMGALKRGRPQYIAPGMDMKLRRQPGTK